MTTSPALTITFPNHFKTCVSLANLRAIPTSQITPNQNVVVDCGVTLGDGLGGMFYWSPASTAGDDGITTIAPSDGGVGRWLSSQQSKSTAQILPTIAAMIAAPVATAKRVTITGSPAAWEWQAGNFTTQAAADPTHSLYQPSSVALVSVGCWVRLIDSAPVFGGLTLITAGSDVPAMHFTRQGTVDWQAGPTGDGTSFGIKNSGSTSQALRFGTDNVAGFSSSAWFGDVNFMVGYTAGDATKPQIAFNATSSIRFDRSTGKYLFISGGVTVASIDGAGNLKVLGNITGNTTP